MSALNVKLSELDKIETELAEAMLVASKCLNELSKDKVTNRTIENHAQDFLRKVRAIESGVLSQINYLNQVGVGAPHEGAAYLSVREKQAAVERLNFLNNALITEHKRVQQREEETQPSASAMPVTSTNSESDVFTQMDEVTAEAVDDIDFAEIQQQQQQQQEEQDAMQEDCDKDYEDETEETMRTSNN